MRSFRRKPPIASRPHAPVSPDLTALKTATAKDGVVVPEFVRQLREAVRGDAARHLHFGTTSQDVIGMNLMLPLKSVDFIFALSGLSAPSRSGTATWAQKNADGAYTHAGGHSYNGFSPSKRLARAAAIPEPQRRLIVVPLRQTGQ